MRILTSTVVLVASLMCTGAIEAQGVKFSKPKVSVVSASYMGRLDALEKEVAELSTCGGCGGCESCSTASSCCDPQFCPGWFASADFLHWKPRQRGMDFAILDPDGGSISGSIESLELESQPGIRVNVGRLFKSGWDVSVTYTNFHSEDSKALAASNGVFPTVIHPLVPWAAAGVATTVDAASARAVLDMDDFNVEAGYWFFPYNAISVRLFGGFRGATVGQNFAATYTNTTVPEVSQLLHNVQMDGLGIRLGGETHWYVSDNISLFGRAAGSVLVGDFHTSHLNTFGPASITNVTDDYYQTVPIIEMAAGVSWQRKQLTVQAGYELATWFNMGDRLAFNGTRSAGGLLPGNLGLTSVASNDLGLDGFFFRLIRGY